MSSTHAEPHGGRTELGLLRRALAVIVVVGAAGLTAELLLLEHYESAWQYTPLGLLVLTMATGTVALVRPTHGVLRTFQAVMSLCVVAGFVGMWLHFQGNMEWELERNPGMRGFALFKEALMGATPALAPGAMMQLGLIGLAFAWRHPAARSTRLVREP